MKKYVFCLALAFLLSLSSYSQNIDQLLKKASNSENVEKVKIDGLAIPLGQIFGDVKNLTLLNGFNSLEIFSLSEKDKKLKRDFLKLFNSSKDGKDYETLIFAKEKDEGIRFLMKRDKDIIENMILLRLDNEEASIIKITGKMNKSNIKELVDEYNK